MKIKVLKLTMYSYNDMFHLFGFIRYYKIVFKMIVEFVDKLSWKQTDAEHWLLRSFQIWKFILLLRYDITKNYYW